MTEKCPICDYLSEQIVPYSTEDREVEESLLEKAGYDMSHPDVDAMWDRGSGDHPGENPFPNPLPITDEENGLYWSLAEVTLWNQKRVEAIIAQAEKSLAEVIYELEEALQGRTALLQHFITEEMQDY